MRFIASITLLLAFKPMLYARGFCTNYLASSIEKKINDTETFTAYLTKLSGENIIGLLQLQSLLANLEQENRIINPIPHQKVGDEIIFFQSIDRIHYQNIQHYIESASLNKRKILKWAKQFYADKQSEQKNRTQTNKETETVAEPMVFYPFIVGKYGMNQGEPEEIKYPFEMMATEVTQYMWAKEMGFNPSHFPNQTADKNSKTIRIGEKRILLLIDHPVENITWWSAAVFANKISEKNGLQPVYDLSHIQFQEGTSAEMGNLTAKLNEGSKLKINAPQGKLELAEGYRLPTGPEMDHAVHATFSYIASAGRNYLDGHWCTQNSGARTHAVAKKMALKMGASEFYDVLGNVWEWTSEMDEKGAYRIKGGSYRESTNQFGTAMGLSLMPNFHMLHVGFRLVRTLK